jgi:hypothetical protein
VINTGGGKLFAENGEQILIGNHGVLVLVVGQSD